jgi:hypothetical protein
MPGITDESSRETKGGEVGVRHRVGKRGGPDRGEVESCGGGVGFEMRLKPVRKPAQDPRSTGPGEGKK